MRLLFIQLSDLHCCKSDAGLEEKIEKAAKATKILKNIDAYILIVSGDITKTGDKEEFLIAKRILRNFITRTADALRCKLEEIILVPGNHDLVLPEGSRGAKEINAWNKDDYIESELERLENFFQYSKSEGCFIEDKLCDVKNICIDDIKLQICLLNSAPFSTREPEDKQLHFFPPKIGEKLSRNTAVDLKITVMHHHYEWCEWDTKTILKNAMTTDDLVFFGHDHESGATVTIRDGCSRINAITGGEFNLMIGKDSTFNTIVYDSNKSEMERLEFRWDTKEKVFTHGDVEKVIKENKNLAPQKVFLDELLRDNNSISSQITDYYVVPKLISDGSPLAYGENSKGISGDDIFSIAKDNKAVRIIGDTGSGKTSLIKYLYKRSVELGYIPILVDQRDYKDSKIEKMFRDLFEEQYGNIPAHWYDLYEQEDDDKKIVFVDDMDLITSSKAQENLVNSIISSGKILIFTTKERNPNLIEVVKDKLHGTDISTIDIKPFYKETRDKLVRSICRHCKKSEDEIDIIITGFDYMVQCQTSFFSFTPTNLLEYIKFFIQGGVNNGKDAQTISMVFENNIRNSILRCEKDQVANKYLIALECIADYMYFSVRREKINATELQKVIGEYNTKRKTEINAKSLLECCVSASILKEFSGSFEIGFVNNNTFAYFIAKSINREFEKDYTKDEKLSYVMNHICFGINDAIILFLSFIRSNTNIVLQIANEAEELVEKFQEWDFEKTNIPFLHHGGDFSSNVPSTKDRKRVAEQAEKLEKERHDMIKFRGIFDYDESDVIKERYVALKALNYSRLIGRALIDQYGSLDSCELDRLVDTLYSVPLKVIYALLLPFEENIDDIVKDIINYVKNEIPDENVTADDVVKMLGQAGTCLALNIMNDVARNASDHSTILPLREGPLKNANHKILLLMMEENSGRTSDFVSRAINLRKEYENSYYIKNLIAQIARKHILCNPSIDNRQIDRLISGHVLSSDSKAMLLIGKGKKSTS